MQVGDLVRYCPGLLHPDGERLLLGIVVEMDTDGTVLVKWPGKPAEYDLEFALEVVNANR
jgi:hypothetical protein